MLLLKPTQRSALVSLHAAVLLFGFAGLFGKWLALSPELIVLGRTIVASTASSVKRRLRRALRDVELDTPLPADAEHPGRAGPHQVQRGGV